MEELAPELLVGDAVDRVADDRQVDRRQVDADLVRAAGLEADVEQRVPVEQALDLEVRDRLARRVGVERVARRLAAVAADRRLDPAGPRARPTADERLVAPLERPRSDELLQPARTPPRCGRRRAGRRCRGRAGGRFPAAPRPRRPRPAPTSPCTSVPLACPGDGWTTRPAGLSTTSRCSSSYAIRSGTSSALRARSRPGSGDGQLELLPALEPVATSAGAAPSTSAAPSSSSRSAAAREPTSAARRGSDRAARPRPRRERDGASSAVAASRRSASATKRIADADDDEAVREVERRPVAQVEEVGHVAEPDRGRSGSRSSRRSAGRARPAAPGGARPSARSRRASSRPRARSAPSPTGVALAKSPNAMPEFWTWWIENGPTTCSDSSNASCVETISFVSWSAAIAANTTAPRPSHWGARAASERSATETGVSASVLRADADVVGPRGRLVHPRSSLRLQSMHCVVHGTASRRSSPIGSPHVAQIP